MSSPNINVIASLGLVTVNVGQNQTTVNVSLSGITLAATETFYNQFYQVLTTGSALTLPSGKSFSFYCRNLGANPITIAYTPETGTPGTMVLVPVVSGNIGGIFMLFETSEGSGGLSAVTLTATTATTPAEVLMAW
jgi:hypothetical protein